MAKGNDFERNCCRSLSLWWTEGRRDDIFWRNRTRNTTQTPHAEHQLGDITSVHHIGIPFIETFNVELKTGYSKTRAGKRTKNIPWDLLDLLDGKPDAKKIIHVFWQQTEQDAAISKRFPLLIFKRDYHTPIVCTDVHTAHTLCDYYGSIAKPVIRYSSCSEDIPFDLFLYRKEDFFQWLNPRTVQLIWQDRLKAKSQ